MKKLIRVCSLLIVICCIASLLFACGEKPAIKYGNYYLTVNENSYIVLSDETISFHNVDFSNIEQDIVTHFGKSIDVSEILAGEQPYDTNSTHDKIYVQIYDIVYLTLRYDNSKKQLSMIGQVFVLQKV